MDISDYSPHADARRFDAGTPPVPNIYAGVAGLVLIAGDGRARDRGARVGPEHAPDRRLHELGATVVTPVDPARRGPIVCVALDRRLRRLVASLAEDDFVVLVARRRTSVSRRTSTTPSTTSTVLLEALAARRHLLA